MWTVDISYCNPFSLEQAALTEYPSRWIIAGVNNGKVPPTMDRMRVFAAMAELAKDRYTTHVSDSL
jgi:hypothetical protein